MNYQKKKPLSPTERMRLKRSRDKALHQRLGGKEKRIHFYNYTINHLHKIMTEGQYSHEDEAIIDALAVAAILIKTDIRQFTELLNKARTKKIPN